MSIRHFDDLKPFFIMPKFDMLMISSCRLPHRCSLDYDMDMKTFVVVPDIMYWCLLCSFVMEHIVLFLWKTLYSYICYGLARYGHLVYSVWYLIWMCYGIVLWTVWYLLWNSAMNYVSSVPNYDIYCVYKLCQFISVPNYDIYCVPN